jgi:hypothetical protein
MSLILKLEMQMGPQQIAKSLNLQIILKPKATKEMLEEDSKEKKAILKLHEHLQGRKEQRSTLGRHPKIFP